MIRCHQLLLLAAAVTISHCMPMGCTEDTHCPSGFFCDPNRLFCHQCISCEHHKRLPPDVGSTCLTKVAECGPCFKSLVSRDEDSECIPRLRSAPLELPAYAWVVIALGMLVLGLLVSIAAVYVLRNFHTFKILACSTRTSVHTPQEQSPVKASAPPPYNAVMGAALTVTTPDSMALEEACPFITPVPVSERQAASRRQGASVFCPPDYRRDERDCGADEAAELAPRDPPTPTESRDSSIDTMVYEVAIATEGGKEPSAPVELGSVELGSVELAVPKTQNGNNSSDEHERGRTHDRQSDSPGPTFIAQSTSPVIINVIKNIQGHHDSSMC